jgi:hypothetical protein
MLVFFIDIWYILQPFGILYGHLAYFVVIWYIFPRFGLFYQEKSGNPGWKANPITDLQRFESESWNCQSRSRKAKKNFLESFNWESKPKLPTAK